MPLVTQPRRHNKECWRERYPPPLIEVNNSLKIEGKKLGQRSQFQKGTSTPTEGCVYAI